MEIGYSEKIVQSCWSFLVVHSGTAVVRNPELCSLYIRNTKGQSMTGVLLPPTYNTILHYLAHLHLTMKLHHLIVVLFLGVPHNTIGQESPIIATPKPFTNPPRLSPHEHADRAPRPPHAPVVPHPTTSPSTQIPIAPSLVPVKPNNPPRGPHAPREHRGPTLDPVAAGCSALALRLSALIGNNVLGSPNAARNVCLGTDTYQGRAVAYIQSLLDAGRTLSDPKLVQYYALACIYYSTNGDGWAYKTGWLSETIDPCDKPGWVFIFCSQSNVTKINFQLPNRLVGDFPNEVVLLSADHVSQAGNLAALVIDSNGATNTNDPNLEWIGGLGSAMRKCNVFARPNCDCDSVNIANYMCCNLRNFRKAVHC